MRRRRVACLAGLVLFGALGIAEIGWGKIEYSREMYRKLAQTTNTIPQIKIPNYQKLVLRNGLVVYLVEDHEAPIVMTKGFVRWGRERETAENAGISDLMIHLMNTGTQKFSESEKGIYIERHALSFTVYSGEQNFSFNGNALTSEQDALLEMGAEMLCRPNFQAGYFNRIKNEQEKGLKQLETTEDGLIVKYFYQNILPGHPYAWDRDYTLRLANLAKLTPDSVMQYYQQSFMPNQTILMVYGDFNTVQMRKKVKKHFGKWAKGKTKTPPVMAVENPESFGRVVLVDKPDAAQAKIMMGYSFYNAEFYERDPEGEAAFEIGNRILGGGDLGSFLMERLRSEKGFVYDVSSGYACNPLGGQYYIRTSVKPEQAYETVGAIKKVLEDVKAGQKTITDTEIFQIINQRNAFFPENFRNKDDVIQNLIYNVELRKRNTDYLNQYIQRYNRVTAAKAQAALARDLFPEKLCTVVVGKKENILPGFQQAGIAMTVVK